ncbi:MULTISPECIES: hypothetical protein [unclassified Mesorhizobium]|uniref:hypothetical protein n=1 Tax=unclassified Mesorhizobium TaxID=325217 RepID=UPI000FD767F9|nr:MULTISPECIES: hypothetical protein [unclassified Mesorhizobium]TGT64120.1 hypothetical protein EN809_035270 [Mesorhizobium sp. M2E.F.Ca.ET.166.01.1.1]TGV96997.1 hypothetical protein EN797_034895 [Mesorhizobium sp. M2E.F.Ca.ET.154.01.1.1]
MSKFYVITGNGRRFESPSLPVMKSTLEYTINTMVSLGYGLIIKDCSPELEDFLFELQKKYPMKIVDLPSSNDKI